MKRKSLILITIICIILLLTFCIIPLLFYRVLQTTSILEDSTIWSSDDYNININVHDETGINGTMVINNKIINISCGTLYDTIEFIDTEKEKAYSTGEAIMFSGECVRNLWENELKINVTESNINKIKSGDEITLHRQN